MRTSRKIFNFYQNLLSFARRYSFIFAPFLGLILYFILLKKDVINIDSENIRSNLSNISGVLAGFLFTTMGIIQTMPDNRFRQVLREIDYLEIIYRTLGLGIIFLLTSLVFATFGFNNSIMFIFFVSGLSEAFLGAYYLYKLSYYSGKSK